MMATYLFKFRKCFIIIYYLLSMTTRQSPTLDPDAEHLQLVKAAWYQRRSFGRTLGRILLLSGASIALIAWMRGSQRARNYVFSASKYIRSISLQNGSKNSLLQLLPFSVLA